MMKNYMGQDGDYTIMGQHSIDHRKKDGTTAHYTSTLEIRDLHDRMEVEKMLKKEKDKPFGSF